MAKPKVVGVISQKGSERPLSKHAHIGAGQIGNAAFPPISAVRRSCREGRFGSLRTEGFPPTLPVNLYNQKSHVLSAAMCAMSESR